MSMTGLIFLTLFMPLGFAAQRLVSRRVNHAVLIVLSAFFIAWGNPHDLLLIIFSAAFNYFTVREMCSLKKTNDGSRVRFVFWSGIAVNTALLLFYKYTGFALGTFGIHPSVALPAAPLGISFYTFSAISFLTDVYRGDAPAPKRFTDLALYLMFFPKFVSGPIVTYRAFELQIHSHNASVKDLDAGFSRFVAGLAKKLILADTLGTLFSEITAQDTAALTVTHAWLGVLLYAFMLYFDFSGYSDMAIGIGRTLGFRFLNNFTYPYLSQSVTVFWRRWHISLGQWFRDYVYIPLGGSRAGEKKTIRNIIIVWMLTGLWHGASWTFVIWGVYHAAMLLLEKFVFADLKKKIPSVANVCLTFLMVIIGWVPFFSESLPYAGGYFLRLFGIGGAGFVNENALFLLKESVLWLVVSFIGGTPFLKRIERVFYGQKAFAVLKIAGIVLMLVLSVASAVSGTFQSFLYAQF